MTLPPQARLACWPLAMLLSFGLGASTVTCTPEARRTLAPMVEPALRATCIMLRALLRDGSAEEVCATAEELAPFVPEILGRRVDTARDPSAGAVVAFKLEAPPERYPRRRCAVWMNLPPRDAGAVADTLDGVRGDGGR